MKTPSKSRWAFLVLSTLAFMQIAKAEEEAPQVKEVTVGVNDVFVPGGFDSETDAFVVVSGLFPNGCYRWKGAEVANRDAKTHEVRTKANVSQGMCLMVMVPFSKEVRLGKLESGTHTLRFLNGDGTYLERTLKVE